MYTDKTKNVTIIGGGVIGLTCAAVLAERHRVTIIAEKFGIESDSVKATAIWHVYLVPETEIILTWAKKTLEKFLELCREHPESGIELVKGVELFRTQAKAIPTWANIPPYFEMLTEEEIATYNTHRQVLLDDDRVDVARDFPVKWGYHIQAPATSMPRYLAWLMELVEKKDVKMERRTIEKLDTVAGNCDCVINCSGFGARDLTQDTDFIPYKGQYFVLTGGADAPNHYIGDDDFPGGMTYVIPRSGEVVVGGTAERGVDNLEPTLGWSSVASRAELYMPWVGEQLLAKSPRLVVGLRPYRAGGIRLEVEHLVGGGTIIHNYGHSGSGFSLSWGCAEEVGRLIENTLI